MANSAVPIGSTYTGKGAEAGAGQARFLETLASSETAGRPLSFIRSAGGKGGIAPPSLDPGWLLVFAEDTTQDVRYLTQGSVGTHGVEQIRHKVRGAFGSVL